MPSRQGGGGNGDPAKRRPAAASTDVRPCHWEPRVGSCSGAVGEGRQHLPVFYQSRGMVGPGSAAVDHERTDRGRERGGAHEGCCSAARTYPIDSIGCWAPLRLARPAGSPPARGGFGTPPRGRPRANTILQRKSSDAPVMAEQPVQFSLRRLSTTRPLSGRDAARYREREAHGHAEETVGKHVVLFLLNFCLACVHGRRAIGTQGSKVKGPVSVAACRWTTVRPSPQPTPTVFR